MPFPTTRWTLLAEATLHGDEAGQAALTRMCEEYRRPIEDFVISRGCRSEDVEDVVQDFFVRWLKSRAWKRADRTRGRFRSFVLGGVMHSLRHYWTKALTQKRGQGVETLSLDAMLESGIEPESADEVDVFEFDRRWAVTLVENTLHEIREEWLARGKEADFTVLRHFLPGASEVIPLEEVSLHLGKSLDTVKVTIHRLRARFRELLRAKVAQTVSAPHEVEEELTYLRTLLLSPPKTCTSDSPNGKTP